jgi:hypothetical protein
MRWITATNLVQWADTRSCEGDLPLLIRKLIIASVKEWPELHIPAGDSVFKPGWDGVIKTVNKARLIPAGASCWEWGRSSDYHQKLLTDFDKRTKATSRDLQRENTFVFVTPRRWARPSRGEVIDSLKARSAWKEILIYDADDLELWLEHCIVPAKWLATELQLVTDNVTSAEEFWKSYTEQPDYTFTPEFIISGRAAQCRQLLSFLSADFGFNELQASSKEEGAAFIVSALLSENDGLEMNIFTKTVIVYDKVCLKQLCETNSGLIIIYLAEGDEALTNFNCLENHVLSLVSFMVNVKNEGIILPVPDGIQFTEGLVKLGVARNEAHNLAKACGKSHNVLRRMLAGQAGRVSWSSDNDVIELIPLFFIQKFDDEKEGDQEILALLAGMEYSTCKAALKRWSLIPDRPVIQIANHWQAVSAYDLLYIVGRYLTEEHLKRFEKAFLQVMSEHDPALELEPQMRVAASLFKKESRYSKRLRDGLCQTLTLISVRGEDSGINTSINLAYLTDGLVKQLFKDAGLPFWQSIESKVHVLAEAAPKVFLETMEDLNTNHTAVIQELFNDQEAGLFNPTYHTHILWALEVLAWDPAFLPRVVLILARLTQLDTGKAYANRPTASLTAILRWWYPQTFSGFDDRKSVIDLLIKRNPGAAFPFLLSLAPQLSDIAMDTHKPVWRVREKYVIAVSAKEYYDGLAFSCGRMLEMAGNDPARWLKVIKLVDDYQGELRQMIIAKIEGTIFDLKQCDELREELRSLLKVHSAAKKEGDWNLTKAEQSALKVVYDRMNQSAADRYLWYFNVDSVDSRATGDDWEKQKKLTAVKRKEALTAVMEESGLSGVFDIVPKVKYPFWVGHTLAQLHTAAQSEVILKLAEEDNLPKMAFGYLVAYTENQGPDWIEAQVDEYANVLSVENLTLFYLAAEGTPALWVALEKRSSTLNERYWQTAYQQYHPWVAKENQDALVKNLNARKRYSTSLNQILDESVIQVNTLIDTLVGYVTENTETNTTLRSQEWLIRKLYKYLLNENAPKDKMHMLEWYYFRLLKKDNQEKSLITYLYQDLNKNPSSFAKLMEFTYIPEEGDPKDENKGMAQENIQGRAENAHAVLSSWAQFPGTDADGTCDFAELRQYFKKAIELCAQIKRKQNAIRELGKLLGRTELAGSEWPHPEVCEIIEEYNDQKFSEGVFDGYYNRHTGEVRIRPARSPDDSEGTEGQSLKALAQKLASKYPVTAKIIDDIAASKISWAAFMKKKDAQSDD